MSSLSRTKIFALILSSVLLSACGSVNHSANDTTVSNVLIRDDNGGSAEVGDTLTGSYQFATTHGELDPDNEDTSAYKWLRDGSAISGATLLTYTVVTADAGSEITFEVTPHGSHGDSTDGPIKTSSPITVGGNSAPTVVNNSLSISDDNGGDAVVGDVLTGSYTYADTEGDNEGVSTFRWLRDVSPISGATSASYTLVAADSGTNIVFEVTPIAATGITTGNAVASSSITVINSAPTASGLGIVDNNGGSAVIGDTLTGSYAFADIDDDNEGTSTFRWLRNTLPISGATSVSYTLVAADSGVNISFEVTPKAVAGIITGNAVISSNVAVSINNAPTASGLSIADTNGGSVVAGDVLTGSYTYADGESDNEGTSTFRWLRGGSPISGATSISYTLIAADVPAQITFEVTPVAATGITAGNAVTSAAIITGSAPVVSGVALYFDINNSGTADANDQLIIPFDKTIVLNSAASSDLNLAVTGDSLGSGATLTSGPASNEITVTLGSSPKLTTRQVFSSSAITANSASGIDVSALMAANAIESNNGVDAKPNSNIDLISAYVDSLKSIGANPSFSVAAGDVDGDGDIDMVVANFDAANLVYLNNGSGSFTVTAQSLGLNSSTDIVLGDVDADGDLDMVVANEDVFDPFGGSPAQGNRVYINDGSGAFTDSGQVLGSSASQSIVLGDVDGDGDLDMAVATLLGGLIYTNDGNGTFVDSTQTLGFDIGRSVALGDIDGDSDLDLVIANDNAANTVFINNGAGVYAEKTQTVALGSNSSQSISLGDVDGDGDLDMVVANDGSANIVYSNDGAGNFSDSGQLLGTNSSSSIVLKDLDADGDLDMVVANLGQANVIYNNNGTGIFSASPVTLDVNNTSTSVAVDDVSGDGDLDIMEANSSGGNKVYFNSLSGT